MVYCVEVAENSACTESCPCNEKFQTALVHAYFIAAFQYCSQCNEKGNEIAEKAFLYRRNISRKTYKGIHKGKTECREYYTENTHTFS